MFGEIHYKPAKTNLANEKKNSVTTRAADLSATAHGTTGVADAASVLANNSGKGEDHKEAEDAHDNAIRAHIKAMHGNLAAAKSADDNDASKKNLEKAQMHANSIQAHAQQTINHAKEQC